MRQPSVAITSRLMAASMAAGSVAGCVEPLVDGAEAPVQVLVDAEDVVVDGAVDRVGGEDAILLHERGNVREREHARPDGTDPASAAGVDGQRLGVAADVDAEDVGENLA